MSWVWSQHYTNYQPVGLKLHHQLREINSSTGVGLVSVHFRHPSLKGSLGFSAFRREPNWPGYGITFLTTEAEHRANKNQFTSQFQGKSRRGAGA